jgi:hypothetical protein
MSDDELTLALQRFDLQAYCREAGAVRAGRSEWLLECPKCLKEKLSVNLLDRTWRCFVCEKYGRGPDGKMHAVEGAGGVFRLVQWLEGLSPSATARTIIDGSRPKWLDPNELPALPPGEERITSWERIPTGLPEGCLPIDGTLPYMLERGISFEDAKSFGLGWCRTGWLANRLVFPVWEQGRCLFWQARAMWTKEEHAQWHPDRKYRKTLNPAVYYCGACHLPFPEGATRCGLCGAPQQYGSADVLGNLEQAARHPRVAICEGPTSGIRAGPSAVWTFGKVLHPQQTALLVKYRVQAVDFMWDGPTPTEPLGAWTEMIQAAAQLAPLIPDIRLVFLPRGDPGDWPRDHLDWFRSTARAHSSIDFGGEL